MSFLLDVNVLVAWGWKDHMDHQRAASWIAKQKEQPQTRCYTSAIQQLGFVRVSVQRSGNRVQIAEATQVLTGMLESLGALHHFLPDDMESYVFPDWCRTAARTTDARLLLLAQRHALQLATLDEEIPGAFLLPS